MLEDSTAGVQSRPDGEVGLAVGYGGWIWAQEQKRRFGDLREPYSMIVFDLEAIYCLGWTSREDHD